MNAQDDILSLDLSQLREVTPLNLYEINGRPVILRKVPGVAKCSLCDRIAKLTVFEVWRGKRIDTDVSEEHRVWHWCGECEESPFPAIADVR